MSPSVPLRLLQTQTDARLVELARGGHERAFEALVQRYRKPLLSYCRRLLLPESRAEDALQQALIQAWLALRDGEQVREPRAWLYRVVHNAAISALRRSGYDYVELDESIHGERAPESDIDRRIAVREALAGLAALPEAQREVLLRTAVQGHSHEQVADALGLSDGAVRGLLYRARASLRAAATAVTPPQVAIWAARAAEGASHPQVGEIIAGGGSAGTLGVLLKGGAVVVSAGMLATGATLVQRSEAPSSSAQADPVVHVLHRRTSSSIPPITRAGFTGEIEPSGPTDTFPAARRGGRSSRSRRHPGESHHHGLRSGGGSGGSVGSGDSGRGGSGARDGGGAGGGGGGGAGGGGGGGGNGTGSGDRTGGASRGSSGHGGDGGSSSGSSPGSGSGKDVSGTSGDGASGGEGSGSSDGSTGSGQVGGDGQGSDGVSGGSGGGESTPTPPAPQPLSTEIPPPTGSGGSSGDSSSATVQSGGGEATSGG